MFSAKEVRKNQVKHLRLMQNLVSGYQDSDFYSECQGKALEGFAQTSDTIWLTFQETHSDCYGGKVVKVFWLKQEDPLGASAMS